MKKIKIVSIMIATLFISSAVASIVGAVPEEQDELSTSNKVILDGGINVLVTKTIGLVLPSIELTNQSAIFKVNVSGDSPDNMTYIVENQLIINLSITNESTRDSFILPRSMFYGILGVRDFKTALRPIGDLSFFKRLFPIRAFGTASVVESMLGKNISKEIVINMKKYKITNETFESGENITINIYVMGFLPDDVNGMLEGTKVVAHKVINLEVKYEEMA